MTYILHLETSTKVCSVTLSKNGEIVNTIESNDDQFAHGEKLTIYIQNILKAERIEPKELHAVSISSGPGSYTGLRIGVSTAKGICYALGIPLIAVDSLTSLKEIAKEKYPNSNIIPAIDARRMEIYSTVFDEKNNQLKEISSDIIDENSYLDFEPFICIGDGAEKLKEIWKNRNCIIDSSIISSANGQVKIAFEKFKNNDFEDVAYFEPFYLKDFLVNGGK